MHRRTWISAAIALAGLASASTPTLGCVADVFTLDRLATESAYVVTATVSEVRSYWTPDHMTIETQVTLTSVNRITRGGSEAEPDITYTVVGGTVGDQTLRLCCAPELRVGDQWVLFLQREYRQHPVLGMERGMFRVEQAQGVPARVLNSGGSRIVAIDADGAVEIAPAASAHAEPPPEPRQPKSVRGSISAVRVVDREEAAIGARGEPAPGLTLEAFLDEVRARLPEAHARDAGEPVDAADITITRVKPAMKPAPLRSAAPVQDKTGGAK